MNRTSFLALLALACLELAACSSGTSGLSTAATSAGTGAAGAGTSSGGTTSGSPIATTSATTSGGGSGGTTGNVVVLIDGTTVATEFGYTHAVAVDRNNVYWNDGSHLNVAPLSGGSATVLASARSSDIALDDSAVYFVDSSNSVASFTLDGGALTPLAADSCPSSLTADSNWIYWSCEDLYGIAKSGGTAQQLSSVTTRFIAVSNGTVFGASVSSPLEIYGVTVPDGGSEPLVNESNTIGGLAIDSANLYWTEESQSGNVLAIPLDGGATVTLATAQNNPSNILVFQGTVYWRNGDGSIWKTFIDGGAVSEVANLQSLGGMAADDTSLYFFGDSFDDAGTALLKLTPR